MQISSARKGEGDRGRREKGGREGRPESIRKEKRSGKTRRKSEREAENLRSG